ncbi:hypothetical protein SK128_006927, partial [Halocaridina rubra]
AYFKDGVRYVKYQLRGKDEEVEFLYDINSLAGCPPWHREGALLLEDLDSSLDQLPGRGKETPEEILTVGSGLLAG